MAICCWKLRSATSSWIDIEIKAYDNAWCAPNAYVRAVCRDRCWTNTAAREDHFWRKSRAPVGQIPANIELISLLNTLLLFNDWLVLIFRLTRNYMSRLLSSKETRWKTPPLRSDLTVPVNLGPLCRSTHPDCTKLRPIKTQTIGGHPSAQEDKEPARPQKATKNACLDWPSWWLY